MSEDVGAFVRDDAEWLSRARLEDKERALLDLAGTILTALGHDSISIPLEVIKGALGREVTAWHEDDRLEIRVRQR